MKALLPSSLWCRRALDDGISERIRQKGITFDSVLLCYMPSSFQYVLLKKDLRVPAEWSGAACGGSLMSSKQCCYQKKGTAEWGGFKSAATNPHLDVQ